MSDTSGHGSQKSYELEELKLYPLSGNSYASPKDISEIYTSIRIYESIYMPFMTAQIDVVDSGSNMISSLPIHGYEKVTIKLKTLFSDKTTYSYTFYVYKISNRLVQNNTQTYTMHLCTAESFINEGVRVGIAIKGKAEAGVEKILKEYLKVTTKEYDYEASKYNQQINCMMKRPYEVIGMYSNRTISSKAKTSSEATATSDSGTDVGQNSEKVTQGSGTAGYLFFETYDKFVFKSIDTLMALRTSSSGGFTGTDPVATYSYSLANTTSLDDQYRILNYSYASDLDLAHKLRFGTLSSVICFFDINTGKYSEQLYSLPDTYKKMGHIGSASGIPEIHKNLSKYPTRMMSKVVNDEAWFDGVDEPARPSDGTTGTVSGGGQFLDWQKEYMSQSIARKKLLESQKLNVIVPGNLGIRAGSKINIIIPKMTYDNDETKKEDPVDRIHSGAYLIGSICYSFNRSPVESTCIIEAVRDSYGMIGNSVPNT